MRGGIVYKKFLKDLWAVFSILYILLLVLVSIFAYQISPDSTSNANQMHLSIHSQSPGFRVNMLVLPTGNKHTNEKSFFSGEVNNRQEIPIQDYKLKSNGVEIQPYGSPSDYYELIEASKFQSPLTETEFRKQHLEENFFCWEQINTVEIC